MMKGVRVALVLLTAIAAHDAQADQRGEAMLGAFVAGIDATPGWSASAAAILSDGDDTILEGLRITLGEPEVTIGVERLRLLDFSRRDGSGFLAAEIEITGASLDSESVAYAVPTALAKDVEMPAFAGATFDPHRMMSSIVAIYAGLAETRLGELTIPEATGSQTVAVVAGESAAPPARFSIRDIALTGLAGGVIADQQAGPTIITSTAPSGEAVTTTIDRFFAERLDLATAVHILDDKQYANGRGDDVWRPLVSRAGYSGLSIQGEKGAIISLGEFALENVDGRQPRKLMRGVWDRVLDPDIPEESKSDLALEALQTMVAAWRVSTVRLDGLGFQAPAERASGSLDSMTVTGLSDQGIDSFILRRLRGQRTEAFVGLESLEFAGLTFPDLAKVIAFAALEPDADPAAQAEKIRSSFAALPRIARFALAGLSAGQSADRAVKIGAVTMEFSGWNAFFADSTDVSIAGVEIPRSLMSLDEATTAVFDKLGYDPLVASIAMRDRWDRGVGLDDATWTLALADGADLELSYTLAGLTEAWITTAIAAAGDTESGAAATQALMSGLRLKGARLAVTDRSLLDRGFGIAAMQQGLSVDGPTYREQIRAALIFLLPAALPAELTKLVSAPLREFLAGGQTLVVEIAPPEPITLPELAAALEADPLGLPNRLKLTLRSEAAR